MRFLPDQLRPNPFLRGRYVCEVARQPEAAFDQFNLELGIILGDLPFYSFEKDAVGSSNTIGNGTSFLHLIGYHLYHYEPYGTTDRLNLPYGEVFAACWELYPDWQWLQLLGNKDFLAPTLEQLYINPVHKSEFGDRKSPDLVRSIIQRSQESGILWLEHGSWLPFGAVVFDANDIPERNSAKLLGLREWLIARAASNLPLAPLDETDFWKGLAISRPIWVLEHGLDLLAVQPGRVSATLRKWSIPSIKSPFWNQFSQVLEEAMLRFPDDHQLLAEYALLPHEKMERATEFLGALHAIASGDTADKYRVWLDG